MLNLAMMPANTKRVFEMLAKRSDLADYVLIGGTALLLQLHHRLSEDLDFCLFSEKLGDASLDALIQELSGKHQVMLMTSNAKITQAKINGSALLDYARDYLIDGVKVSFFAKSDSAYQYFSGLTQIRDANISFGIMEANAVFAMKSWLIQKRIRSRDLYDLMAVVKMGLIPFETIFQEARAADVAIYSEELIKDVLIGNLSVDVDDEGFDSISFEITLEDIYRFFSEQVDIFEVKQAKLYQ